MMRLSFTRRMPYILAAIGTAGFVIGSYLTIAHWGDQPIACGGVGDCGYVNSSEYATVGSIPVSGLGALMYLAMTFVAIAWIRRSDIDWMPIAYWGLALSGAGYAAYLTYVELAILHAICIWCVTSAVLLALSLIFASVAVFGDEPDGEEPAAQVRSGDGRLVAGEEV